MNARFEEVAQVIQTYLDGLYFSDVDKLRSALHSRAIYVTATEEELVYRTMSEYLPIVAGRPSPASRGEPRRDLIESIEFAGDKHAHARVRCAIGDRHFTDLLTFVYSQSGWQIISKVFHYDTEAS